MGCILIQSPPRKPIAQSLAKIENIKWHRHQFSSLEISGQQFLPENLLWYRRLLWYFNQVSIDTFETLEKTFKGWNLAET